MGKISGVAEIEGACPERFSHILDIIFHQKTDFALSNGTTKIESQFKV